ncbi:MAG: hypothetical protein QM764_16390 [Chitinophagaceae bacterium]
MKSFIAHKRHSIVFRAISPAIIVSVSLYVFVRILFYEFPMTWMEEIIFFFKLVFTGSLVISSTLVAVRWFYFYMLKLKHRIRQVKGKLSNSLFLKKNRDHVHYPAYSN